MVIVYPAGMASLPEPPPGPPMMHRGHGGHGGHGGPGGPRRDGDRDRGPRRDRRGGPPRGRRP
jgi:hypothetical protein